MNIILREDLPQSKVYRRPFFFLLLLSHAVFQFFETQGFALFLCEVGCFVATQQLHLLKENDQKQIPPRAEKRQRREPKKKEKKNEVYRKKIKDFVECKDEEERRLSVTTFRYLLFFFFFLAQSTSLAPFGVPLSYNSCGRC